MDGNNVISSWNHMVSMSCLNYGLKLVRKLQILWFWCRHNVVSRRPHGNQHNKQFCMKPTGFLVDLCHGWTTIYDGICRICRKVCSNIHMPGNKIEKKMKVNNLKNFIIQLYIWQTIARWQPYINNKVLLQNPYGQKTIPQMRQIPRKWLVNFTTTFIWKWKILID